MALMCPSSLTLAGQHGDSSNSGLPWFCRRQYMPLEGNHYPEGEQQLLDSKAKIKAQLGSADEEC